MNAGPHASFGDARRQFELLVQNVTDYALLMLDSRRHVVTWSAGAQRMTGWTEAQMIGRSADVIFTPEDRANGDPDKEADKAMREGRAEDERPRRAPVVPTRLVSPVWRHCSRSTPMRRARHP